MDALIAGLASIFGGLIVYLGNKHMAKSQKDSADEQIELSEIQMLLVEYKEKADNAERDIKDLKNVLGVSIQYITLLRTEMRASGVAVAPVPDQLRDVSWDLYTNE